MKEQYQITLNLMIKEKLNILDKLKKEELKENEKINLFKDYIFRWKYKRIW